MEYKQVLDNVYNEICFPLVTYQKNPTDMILGVSEYEQLLADVLANFQKKMNIEVEGLIATIPDKKDDIHNYVAYLKNELISTYQPNNHSI